VDISSEHVVKEPLDSRLSLLPRTVPICVQDWIPENQEFSDFRLWWSMNRSTHSGSLLEEHLVVPYFGDWAMGIDDLRMPWLTLLCGLWTKVLGRFVERS